MYVDRKQCSMAENFLAKPQYYPSKWQHRGEVLVVGLRENRTENTRDMDLLERFSGQEESPNN
jgi:hypothetical protein